jgi:hypothetical protein
MLYALLRWIQQHWLYVTCLQGSMSANTEQLEEQLVENTEAVEECMAALQVGFEALRDTCQCSWWHLLCSCGESKLCTGNVCAERVLGRMQAARSPVTP